MYSIDPVSDQVLAQSSELQNLFEGRIERYGHVPNSMLLMAHWPDLTFRVDALVQTVFWDGQIPRGLKMLMFLLFSSRWGCRYCQAHAASNTLKADVDTRKIEALWEFADSDEFTPAEVAALRLARDACLAEEIGEQHFAQLREHYSHAEIVELVAVLSTGAFLNTWNSAMGTQLEDLPHGVASQHLAPIGWEPGKHDAVT
jgi:alkylhydroperoxidase family enzyme